MHSIPIDTRWPRPKVVRAWRSFAVALVLAALAPCAVAQAQAPSQRGGQFQTMDALSVVLLRAQVPQDARSTATLGSQRQGSGIVIDSTGLILTIGYLILEAEGIEVVPADGKPVPASLVGYDFVTGLGLVRTAQPLSIKPLELGESAALLEREPVLIAGYDGIAPAYVVSKRPFAGFWEYMLDQAIFTAPATVNWSGAALIGRDGKLYGVGSLVVTDAIKPQTYSPGNMFVPIDELKPILADLQKTGKRADPERPWLGITAEAYRGRVVAGRIAEDSPAAKAGIAEGDVLIAVAGKPVSELAEFFRAVWAVGPAGVQVPLTVLDANGKTRDVALVSVGRNSWFRADKGL